MSPAAAEELGAPSKGDTSRSIPYLGELSVESVYAADSVVTPGQRAIPLEVTVRNDGASSILVQSVMPLFTLSVLNDRVLDYDVQGDFAPNLVIAPGGSHIFSFLIDVLAGAEADVAIRLDAAVAGYLVDTHEAVSDSTAASPDDWFVAATNLKAFIALYDTRRTAVRSDDSLIAYVDPEIFPFNVRHYLNGGDPIADILCGIGTVYRLVLQFNPSVKWDFEPRLSGQGIFALAGPLRGFGRASAPLPGLREMLLTDTLVANELADSIDFVVGKTNRNTPAQPWGMLSDPWIDSAVDVSTTSETASLLPILPLGSVIDCVDGTESWELSGSAEKERYQFYELWIQPDLEWRSGDTADIYVHIDGKEQIAAPDLDQLHMLFRVIDDDTLPPTFSDFSPELMPSGEIYYITCKIDDQSGVYDDGTGSGGQGVYLLWDDDGSVEDDANEMTMSAVGGGYYRTDATLGSHASGEMVVYKVHACDDDSDYGAADRSCAFSGLHTIQFVGSAYLIDAPRSLYPASVYAGQGDVSIHIELSNPMAIDIVLNTASTVTLTDGSSVVTANLRNETRIPAGAVDFPIAFDPVAVPSDFIAPDTVAVRLALTGSYGLLPYVQTWTASETNRLTILKPRVLFRALTVPSGPAYPGDARIELMRLEVVNDSPDDARIDSVVVSNVTRGKAGVPLNDADFGMVRFYRQASEYYSAAELLRDSVDASRAAEGPAAGALDMFEDGRALNPLDSLVAQARFHHGWAKLRLSAGRTIPAGTGLYYYVAADVDSFLACDGDLLDIAVFSPDSIFIGSGPAAEFAATPLNSEGACPVDGFVSFQLWLEDDLADTLFLGDSGQPVLSFILPVNGYSADVLKGITIRDFGDHAVDTLIERLALWMDDGDGAFIPGPDSLLGHFSFTGDRFALSGLSVPLAAPRRFFAVADLGFGSSATLEARFGVPIGGIEYASRNDGPIDGDVKMSSAQLLVRREIVSITALHAPAGARHPGDRGIELLGMKIDNNTLGEVTVDSLRVTGNSSLFACENAVPFTLYADDGDGSFDPAADHMLMTAAWSDSASLFADLAYALESGAQQVFYVAADLDSFLTVDGETLLVRIDSERDISLALETSVSEQFYRLDADFPIVSPGGAVTDGMLAHQVLIHPHGDSTIVNQRKNILVLDLTVPGNGCRDDSLKAFAVMNLGTAEGKLIERLILWQDDGDGAFDPATDDSIGEFVSWAARTYEIAGFSRFVAGDTGGRFFVTMDVYESIAMGGTFRAAIPVMGIQTASGNDGPIDREIESTEIFIIPVPDRVTIMPSSLGNKRVRPGEKNVLNLVVGMYNSYQEAKTLEMLSILSIGSSRPDEIVRIDAYADSDEDGLFDPAADSLLRTGQMVKDSYLFDELNVTLVPFRNTLLFIAYETVLAELRDSTRIDFQIPDNTSIAFSEGFVVMQGEFPINSAGIDVTDGMVSAQMHTLFAPDLRVSTGATDVPCFSFVLPCNGTSEDLLQGLSITNGGTAEQGFDIQNLELWNDEGSVPGEFDAEDDFLPFLVWDGSRWKTGALLAEPISCEGLVLHVTADIAPSARNGKTIALCIPKDGVTVLSGNDGPIDAGVCGAREVEITTDPLFVSFESPAAVTRDQIFEIRLNASNVADTTIHGVAPDSFTCAGSGSCDVVSGPSPGSFDLAGKSDSAFVWMLRAQTTGEVVLRARARGEGGSVESRFELSDAIRIDEIPDGVAAAMSDLAPVSLNRGQEDAPMVEFTVHYDPPGEDGAPVLFASFELSMTDEAGAPLPVRDVASKLRIMDESRVLCSLDGSLIGGSTALLEPADSVVLLPGEIRTFRLSIDVSPTAAADQFRIEVVSAAKLRLLDANSGADVPFTGVAFPWRTSPVALKDPAGMLQVRFIPTLSERVNKGQEDVEALDLILENNGSSSAAPVSVSKIVFRAKDAAGDSAGAGSIFKSFEIRGSSGYTYARLESFASSSTITCLVQPAVIVSSDAPVTLRAFVDCLSEPQVSGFALAIEDSLAIDARDVNSGRPVDVRPADGAPVFPMNSGTALFFSPLESVDVSGEGLMGHQILAGSSNVGALRLILSHPGPVGESPFACAGFAIRIMNELGSPLAPADVLNAVRVKRGGTELASVFITGLHEPDIPLLFAAPLITSPGDSDTLEVLLDLDASPSVQRFQLHVNAGALGIADATDGRIGIPLNGSFPITSGLGSIIFPAEGLLFAGTGLLPANIAAGTKSDCMRLVFKRADQASGSRVLVEGILFDVLDEGDRALDPSAVVTDLRFDGAKGEIASTWQVTGGRLSVDFADTVAVEEGEERAIVFGITIADKVPARAVRLRIVSAEDVRCTDEGTGEPVSVGPAEGDFPFGSGTAVVLAADIGASFSNYPNPFVAGSGKTRITFFMPGDGRASLRVFTVTGEPVVTIIEDKQLAAGLHQEFEWDGKNGNGDRVLSGVYYLLLEVTAAGESYTFKRKVALVR